jgi:hypothetical protein
VVGCFNQSRHLVSREASLDFVEVVGALCEQKMGAMTVPVTAS